MSKRICILSDSPHFFPPFTVGGSVSQLWLLAKTIVAAGHEVTIVARTPEHGIATQGEPTHIKIEYVGPGGEQKGKGWGALWPSLMFIWNAFWYVIQNRASSDYFIVSGFRLLAVPGSMAARLLGKPCVVRIEDANDLTFSLSKESMDKMGKVGVRMISAIVRTLYWVGFRLPSRVIAFTPEIADRLRKMGAPAARIATIPNGIESGRFVRASATRRQEVREQLGLPSATNLFLYCGRLTRSKGFGDLVRAWVRFAGDRRDVGLVVLGEEGGQHDGCESEARQLLAENQVADSVDFRGAVQNVSDYLQAADVFVALSYGETFGLSIVEALATGLPTLTTRVGIVNQLEAIPGWGIVIDVGASEMVTSSSLNELLARKAQWPSMGDVSTAMVDRSFSITRVAQQYLALF